MQIDWWTLVLQAINFLVLVWLLWRFLFRPVKRVIEKRKALSEEAFDKAAKKEAEAEAARAEYEEKRAALADERQETLKRLHQELEEERAKVLDAARQEAEQLRKEAEEKTQKERQAALKALRQDVVDLAADLAGKLLRDSAAQPSQEKLLTLLDAHLKALDDGEVKRLREDLEPEDARLLVVTAQKLSSDRENEIKSCLSAHLAHGKAVDFSVEPGLLGGLELRFPHNVISFTWADQLRQAKDLMSANDEAS
jgi:F-type H+-transporting ATPase subunit b